jgi:hypothetical protein
LRQGNGALNLFTRLRGTCPFSSAGLRESLFLGIFSSGRGFRHFVDAPVRFFSVSKDFLCFQGEDALPSAYFGGASLRRLTDSVFGAARSCSITVAVGCELSRLRPQAKFASVICVAVRVLLSP